MDCVYLVPLPDFRTVQYVEGVMKRPQKTHPALTGEISKPSSKATAWAENNSWFQSKDHIEMTAYTYGVHDKMVRQEGIDPESDEYYEELDKRVQSRFPEYFG
jgi:hypothetical protein|tara:strand:+ start:926 stop:1234 length:309 start_codon:yes stop_codon:yes gene_type:complete